MGFSSGDHFVVILFVGVVAFFGLALLFVRSTVIERTGLVGGLTVLSAAVAGMMLASPANYSAPSLLGIAFIAISGYIVGRIADRVMGPMEIPVEMDENTLGAELAD
ncbi:hypothetical protein EON81_08135 [bacterium]|nr:MAG: hypothetical protein EON81_08135 [bacterium]